MANWFERLTGFFENNPRAAINTILLLGIVCVGMVVVFLFKRSDSHDKEYATERASQQIATITNLTDKIKSLEYQNDKLSYRIDSLKDAHNLEELKTARESKEAFKNLLETSQKQLEAIQVERRKSATYTYRNDNLMDKAIEKVDQKL